MEQTPDWEPKTDTRGAHFNNMDQPKSQHG